MKVSEESLVLMSRGRIEELRARAYSKIRRLPLGSEERGHWVKFIFKADGELSRRQKADAGRSQPPSRPPRREYKESHSKRLLAAEDALFHVHEQEAIRRRAAETLADMRVWKNHR